MEKAVRSESAVTHPCESEELLLHRGAGALDLQGLPVHLTLCTIQGAATHKDGHTQCTVMDVHIHGIQYQGNR